jgi:hypothetical protein
VALPDAARQGASRQHRRAIVVLAVLFVLIGAFVVFAFTNWKRPEQQPPAPDPRNFKWPP